MGKSDPIIFEEYRKALKGLKAPSSIAFLGFPGENNLTMSLNASVKNFYDLSLNNWEINDDWSLGQKYDLIVCTRCAYFSKDPEVLIKKIKNHLTVGGHALIDWGLGDHWRFKQYKVGWIRNGEQEYAYHPSNFLHSCYWNDNLSKDEQVQDFWKAVKSNPNFGYEGKKLEDIITSEVPQLVDYACEKLLTKFLWPESPQLYIITLIKNDYT